MWSREMTKQFLDHVWKMAFKGHMTGEKMTKKFG
jgi:hypothetical protein